MSDVEFFCKLRDGAQLIADACAERLEKMAPPQTKELPWAVDKIAWTEATGAKGIYFRANPQSTIDYKNMLQDIKNHGGKMNRDGWFFWCFSDLATVGRKKR